VIRGVASNGQHPDLAWSFLVANFEAVTASLDSLGRYRLPPSVAASAADARQAMELRDFAVRRFPADARGDAYRIAALIDLRARVRAERLPEVDRWLAESGSVP
jgi:hypothetical protein